MFQTLKDLFSSKKKPSDTTNFQEEKAEKLDVGKVIGDNDTFDYNSIFYLGYGNKRLNCTTVNMDRILELIKNAILDYPLLARTIMNITGKVSKQDFYFVGDDKNKVLLVAEEFNKILKSSNYSSELFLKDCFNNFVKYSNLFLVPFRNEKKQIERIRIFQNQGWTVHKKIGTGFCEEFIFKTGEIGTEKTCPTYKNKIDVFHYTFNRESDEIFALPIWCSVIEFLKKYNTLIDNSLVSYRDQSLVRTIYEIGISKNGSKINVSPITYNTIKNLLETTDSDLITDTPVNANLIKKNFTSPDKLLEVLEGQIVAGLFTSKNQLGISSAGRQDSEVQDENTKLIAENFSSTLQHFLNQSIIKEICKKHFGDYEGENEIKLNFYQDFNIQERIEKHAVFLFQGGVIDLDEARKICIRNEEINKEKTFFRLYQQTEMNGSVENTNNPKNQHVPTGTGTTKKTKKDQRR
ncbi:hypothetical protein [Fusobacterium necrophorum]|uniref:hypothetical protein n=1 Tax=Fusobacterium necrophorum TaxID=859 RepID=UPI00370E6E2C